MHDTEAQDNITTAIAKLPEGAQQLVARWTKGLSIVTCLKPHADTVLTVCKDEKGAYYVTAYFTIGAVWQTSCDAQGVTADEAFKKLAIRMS